MSGIDRRALLKGMGGAAALAGAGPGLLVLPGCGRGADLETALLACLGDADAARGVGREALPRLGDPGRRQLVRELAGEDFDAWQALAASDSAGLFEALRAQHLEDFAQARTLSLRGWVLSRTEVRLCALFAATG